MEKSIIKCSNKFCCFASKCCPLYVSCFKVCRRYVCQDTLYLTLSVELRGNRYFYLFIVWLVSIVVALIIDCLFLFNAKPNCLASFFEFIVCNIAIIFCIITMYYWYKYYKWKINIILFNVLQYLIVKKSSMQLQKFCT